AAPEAVEGEARAGAVGAERAVQRVLDGYTRARGERTERARGARRETGRARQRLAEPGAEPRQVGARREGQVGDTAGQVEGPRGVRVELGPRHARGREAYVRAVDDRARGAMLERHAAEHGVRQQEVWSRVA